MKKNYDDIICLPHHRSKKHQPMTIEARAAQFSPFAALTGYESAIGETARLTSEKTELDENQKGLLDMKLSVLNERITEHPEITVTYFIKDNRKVGGQYVTASGRLDKIDIYHRSIVLQGEISILIEDIMEIDGDVLGNIT